MRTAEIFGVLLLVYYLISSAVAHGFQVLERRMARGR